MIGSAGEDGVDSLAFMGGSLYAGGRTTGALNGPASGSLDGFISRIDPATGAIIGTSQFGQPLVQSGPVLVSAASGGGGVTGALGFHRGCLNPDVPPDLVSQTALRSGDRFTIRVDGGASHSIVIGPGTTLRSLADEVRKIARSAAMVSTPRNGGSAALRIDAAKGHSIELVAGPDGRDALAKLGIAPARLSAAAAPARNAPPVEPGGAFGLALSTALAIDTPADAATALGAVKAAMSMTQTAFRSLYWDDAKAARADGAGAFTKGKASPYQEKQADRYRDALGRIAAFTGIGAGS